MSLVLSASSNPVVILARGFHVQAQINHDDNFEIKMPHPSQSSPASELPPTHQHPSSTPASEASSSSETPERSSIQSDRRSSERDQDGDQDEDQEDLDAEQGDEYGQQDDDYEEEEEDNGVHEEDEEDEDQDEDEAQASLQSQLNLKPHHPNTNAVSSSATSSTITHHQTHSPPPTNPENTSISPPPSDKKPQHSTIDHSATVDIDISYNQLNPNSYKYNILERFRTVTKPRTFKKPPLIDSIVFIPHGCPIHALALPPCGSHLFSGGQDGFIRRISIYDSVTGSSLENLTMKQGGHVPLVEKDTDKSTIFLTGYWENEDYLRPNSSLNNQNNDNDIVGEKKIPLKWGPKSVGNATLVSPVYSLAIHNEELWGLSGTESGNINLFTIRHDEGHIRHVLRASGSNSSSSKSDIKGHKPGSVISSLDLNADQNFAFSGGWDGFVLGWDLNTGQVVNRFIAHASQISSVSLRHTNGVPIYDSTFEENLIKRRREEEEEEEEKEREGKVPESERRFDASEHVTEKKSEKDSDAMVIDDDSNEAGKKKAGDETTTQAQQDGSMVPSSSPEKQVVESDKNEEDADDNSDEDGSLFGGVDNSESDIGDSPLASVVSPEPTKAAVKGATSTPTGIANQKKPPEKPSIPPLILPTAAIIKPRLPLPLRKPELPRKNLTQVPSVLDPSLPFLNDDVLMTSGIDGQVYLWDRRVGSNESSGGGFVRKLDVPKGTSPWTASASWSIDGRSIYVGRRNNSVDIYDLRYIKTSNPKFNILQNQQHFQRSIKLPNSSGPVSCVKPWPDGLNLLCASFDNLRLFNLNHSFDSSTNKSNKLPFKIIPGHSSGVVSQMCVTPSCRYLVTASGDRGWQNISNDLVVIHEIRNLT